MCKFVMVSYAGYHAEDIPKGAVNQVDLLFWRYINNILHNPVLGLVKISFLITLLKLRSYNRWIIASLWTSIAVNIVFIILAVLGGIVKCWPIEKAWHPDIPGHCPHRPPYIYGTIGTTIATDFLVSLIPAWIIHDLRMPMKNKVAVILFLSLPLAVTAIGCYRLQMFIAVFRLPKGMADENPYNVRNALTNIEGNLGVIAACGPTIKWILARFIPYFDTSPKPDPFVPSPLSNRWRRFRGYRRSNGDIELQTDILHDTLPQNSVNSGSKVDDDKGSEKQGVTVETKEVIERTTTVDVESAEVLKANLVLEPKK
ncbi:hypothetical protein ACJQWK_10525 [Exserohilum turcicum]|uniref:Rhodopsin domain-containing protein n=1 Tax=Exserohilum turcicum (strain 28A) TaxID=671987 RepID=R0JYW1_EXST2|nr:uncharacterized protein SETTUDRAFT_174158 [Exserohilum turcica Et28A]EOA81437.1 hypothetical protein SETTUDRAFT_174158 [Exserohilum turcica Et28A]